MKGTFEDPRRFLARHHLRPKESFGQCFLVAAPVADAIVSALSPREDETIVDIGTGCLTLARMIAPEAARVIAIERDRDLVAALRADGMPDRVQLVEADAATFDYASVCAEQPTSIVGNLPYQITGRLVRAIVSPGVRFRCAVIMVQKEVSARMLARPGSGDWGAMGVFVNAACEVEKVVDASPRCFHPPPRVTSTVVKLVRRAVPLAEETEAFSAVVHALFSARRKTVVNGLAGLVGKEEARRVLSEAGVDARVRPEELTVDQLGAVARGVPGARRLQG